MKTILRFEFDNRLFYPEYQGPENVIFENPSHIPQTGDCVEFDITAFFDDTKVIKAYKDLTEGQLLYAERLSTRYTPDTAEIIVVLYDEKTFKACYPHLMSDRAIGL